MIQYIDDEGPVLPAPTIEELRERARYWQQRAQDAEYALAQAPRPNFLKLADWSRWYWTVRCKALRGYERPDKAESDLAIRKEWIRRGGHEPF